jgi:hypothetical protein
MARFLRLCLYTFAIFLALHLFVWLFANITLWVPIDDRDARGFVLVWVHFSVWLGAGVVYLNSGDN